MPTQPHADAAQQESSHALACMEIWGGNETIDNALSSPGIDAFVYSRPYEGQHAGGDVHYVSMCGSGRLARFVVADVSGHGGSVAQIATTLRYLMRRNINTLDNTRFTRALNESFQMEKTGGKYATAVLASYFAPTDELIVVNAGHPRPLYFRADRAEWTILSEDGAQHATSASNLPLGIIDPTEFSQFVTKLRRGDLVFFYTDGLMEAKSPSGEMLGELGLLKLIGELDAAQPDRIIRDLLDRIERYQDGKPIEDDVTCVLLHHNAGDVPIYSMGEYLVSAAKMLGLLRT
jgi:serine phosphatase RsbU (regulator of sigma subunit)